MYTEDDTFRALRQTPFEEMRRLVRLYYMGKKRVYRIHFYRFLKSHGWDPDTYQRLSNQAPD